jgi:hypothetical protein
MDADSNRCDWCGCEIVACDGGLVVFKIVGGLRISWMPCYDEYINQRCGVRDDD